MTPDLSDYERATAERIEVAPAAEESFRERVARAISETRDDHSRYGFPCRCGWDAGFGVGWEKRVDRHLQLAAADAAIAVMRGTP